MDRLFYPAVFHRAEEGGFWVTFPDIPECMTQGDDMQQGGEGRRTSKSIRTGRYQNGRWISGSRTVQSGRLPSETLFTRCEKNSEHTRVAE